MALSSRTFATVLAVCCLTAAWAGIAQGGDEGSHPQFTGDPGTHDSGPSPASQSGNEFSVAAETPWPDPVGTHFHSDDTGSLGSPPDLAEIGECCAGFSDEEVRGLGEIDLLGQVAVPEATLKLEVLQLGGIFGQPFGTFDVEVVTYAGNNAENISDYSALPTSTLGTFSTAGLSAGDIVSFDITGAYNAAIAASRPAIGVRLQAASNPAAAAVVFGNFEIDEPPPPVPTLPRGWMVLLALALFIAAARASCSWRRAGGRA